ncbi:MAG TPA: IPT/TIG domain-containing protein [Bryobacteraceae bacterium]
MDPSDRTHWLVGVGNGGVWETRDSGSSFTPLSDAWPTLVVGAVAFAPSDPKIIYVGTGEATLPGVTKGGLGLMKSTDGGKTWTLIAASTFARASVRRIRVHPTNPNILLATVSRGGFGRDANVGMPSSPPFGVVRSIDGGATWTRTLAGQATALEVDPTNFNNQYAAIGEQFINDDSPGSSLNGVYRSTDGGQTWAPIIGSWGASTATRSAVGRVELAIAPSNRNVLYASIQTPPNGGRVDTGLLGLYRSDNAWAEKPEWIQIPTVEGDNYCSALPPIPFGVIEGKCGYSHVISVDPSDPNILFAGGIDLRRCTDCRQSAVWTRMPPGPGDGDYHALEWSGGRLIGGSDHTVRSTNDRGGTWQGHTETLSLATFYGAALHPSDPNMIVGGVRDLAGVLMRRGSDWNGVLGQSAVELGEAEVAVSDSRPDTDWMAAHIWGVIGRTRDGGKTWIEADTGIDQTDSAFVAPVRKCPGNDDIFLTGTTRLWRTDNFFNSPAPTWVPDSPPGPTPVFPNPATVLEIEFLASDATCNSYVYGNRGGQVQITRDGGKTWKDLDPGKNLPARPVNGLAFDPANPNILYAAVSSFDDATPGKPGHIFKSTNALAASPTWVNISPPLNQPFNVIRVDPKDPKLIYAGSDTGLWRSTDAGATWIHDGPDAGVPNAEVYDIKINPNTGVTAVFTYGRGAFGLGFPKGPEIISNSRSPAHGATYIAGGLVPGSWAQVQGTNLSTVTRTWNDADFLGLGNNLPTKLDGIEVKVNGISAAVYYISDTQISFQVPSGVLSGPSGYILVSSPVTVQVFRNGVGGNVLTTTGTSSAPGIFPITINGKNYAAGVFYPDGKITGDPANGSAFRKARPGDAIQLYVAGLNRIPAGMIPTSQTYRGVTVKIGDITFLPDVAALVGPGQFQINFTVPQQFAALPEGEYPISVQLTLDDGATTTSPEIINSDPPGPVLLPIQH